MLTVPEVCKRLGISKDTCYRLMHSGAIRYTRANVGRHRYLIDPETVEKILGTEDFYAEPAALPRNNAPRLYTSSEVAEILRCSVETARRLAQHGTIPAVRNPGKNSHWRFRETDVMAYLDAGREDLAS